MKRTATYLKDRMITGIIVLVPATILVVLLADIVKKIIRITAPLTKKFAVGGIITETVIAVILITLVLSSAFLIIGMIFNTNPGLRFQKWLQESFLNKVPLYKTLRGITLQVTGANRDTYPVVEVDLHGCSTKAIGLMTDTLPDGRSIVYIPFAPILNIGQVYIVPKEKIEILDMSLKDASDIITQIGFEANTLYKTKRDR